MTYATDTILVRDLPKGDRFDRLQVVGPSPIRTTAVGEWGGGAGEAIIVTPIGSGEFGGPEILPLRAAAEQYTVESEPDLPPTHLTTEQPRQARPVRQLTPEEQFRAESKLPVRPDKAKRVRTAITSE